MGTLEEPQSLTFPTMMTEEDLIQRQITHAGILVQKGKVWERIKTTASLGKDSLWSSENLYRQLLWLEAHISRSAAETSTRAWINAFLFRASAMLPEDKQMVINMEGIGPATTVSPLSLSTLSGSIDYSAVVTSRRVAEVLLTTASGLHALETLKQYSFVKIVETKPCCIFSEHIPQAVSEMYTNGKFLEKKFIRGVVTNGHEWVFLYLKFTDDYEGASYSHSSVITWMAHMYPNGDRKILRSWPEVIAAILADWIENSFASIDSNDWFKLI